MKLWRGKFLTNRLQSPFSFVKLRELCQRVRFSAIANSEKLNRRKTMKEEKRGLCRAAPLNGITVIAARTIQHNPLFGGAHG